MGGRGAEGTGGCGLAGRVVFLSKCDGVWRGEKVVLSQQLESRVVVVVVDTKVNNEPVLRGCCVG